MAKTKKDTEQADAPQSEREMRWAAFLEKARLQNPTVFDMQKENGEFDTIPENF